MKDYCRLFTKEENAKIERWLNDNVSYSKFERLFEGAGSIINRQFYYNEDYKTVNNSIFEEAKKQGVLTAKGIAEFEKVGSWYYDYDLKACFFYVKDIKSFKIRNIIVDSYYKHFKSLLKELVFIFVNYKFDDGLSDMPSITQHYTCGFANKVKILENIEKKERINNERALEFEQQHAKLFNRCYGSKQCI